MRRLLVLAVAVAAAVVAATAEPGAASRFLRVGIYDESQTLYTPSPAFALFRELKVQQVRLNLYWGGRLGVATRRPASATNPNDPAYRWTVYDRAVRLASASGIGVVFSIYGTPAWANGSRGANVPPARPADLRSFAYAAARRYSGSFAPPGAQRLPAVKEWLAWNEPNNPVFLSRSTGARRVAGSSRARSTTRGSARRSTAASTGRSSAASESRAA